MGCSSSDSAAVNKNAEKAAEQVSSSDEKLFVVNVLKAKNLPSADADGGIDPYFKVQLGDQIFRTDKREKDKFPTYNNTFSFANPTKVENITFTLFDTDEGEAAQWIAKCILVSDNLPEGVSWITMVGKVGEYCGELEIAISRPTAPTSAEKEAYVPFSTFDDYVVVTEAEAAAAAAAVADEAAAAAAAEAAVAAAAAAAAEDATKLIVKVLKARDLPSADADGGIDPYFKVEVGDQMFRTEKKGKTHNPIFNNTFKFTNPPPADKPDNIKFTLFDTDEGAAAQWVAKCILVTDNLPEGVSWIVLVGKFGEYCGELQVEVKHPSTRLPKYAKYNTQFIPFSTYHKPQ